MLDGGEELAFFHAGEEQGGVSITCPMVSPPTRTVHSPSGVARRSVWLFIWARETAEKAAEMLA